MIVTLKNFDKYYGYLLSAASLIFCASLISCAYSIYYSPLDYQQSNAVKIMYIHVPSAWMGLFIYSGMAVFNISGFVWKNPFFYTLSRSVAPIGAMFALITLITGSIWGKPIWGAWFAFDPRLTSTLILFLLYLGYIVTINSIENKEKGEKIAAVISIVGLINIPIVKFSVEVWNSLHQPASILRFGSQGVKKVSIDPSMLMPLLLTTLCYFSYFVIMWIISIKSELIQKKIDRSKLKNSII